MTTRAVWKAKRVGGERYELIDVLGAGGMGCVYLARDSVLSREVALKLLDDSHAGSEEFVERFRREAQAAASLSHPNIVAVYDFGENQRGAPYLAMEYVAGGTLKQRIRQKGKLPPRVVAGVALQIASALEAAHKRGIVHRDVKPENVLVTEQGNIKVADFGIARTAARTAVTAAGTVLGSVRYISPEQAGGEDAGPASDLYSLGVILYEMLSGRVPFEAENPIATAMQHLTELPKPPSKFEPRVPAALEAVTLKLLEKDPADRYPSAEALARDLKRVLAGAAPAVPVPTEKIISAGQPRERLTKPSPQRRRGILVALAIIPALAVLAMLAFGIAPGLEGLFSRLIGERMHGPFPRAEVPAIAAGGSDSQPAAPEPPHEQGGVTEDSGWEEKQDELSPPGEKVPEPKPQQQTVLTITHKQPAPLAARSTPQPVQQQAPETVAVPDLTAMSVAEAKAALGEIGLTLKIASYVWSAEVPKGEILSQGTPPGHKVYPGGSVAVTVSSGSPPTPEPEQEPQPTPVRPEKVEPVEPLDVEPREVEVPEVEVTDVESVEQVGEKDDLKGDLLTDLEGRGQSDAEESLSQGARPGSG